MRNETAVEGIIGPQSQSQWLDLQLVRLVARQHAVVSSGQLIALGFTRDRIKLRLRNGRLREIHRGVYAVGGAKLTREGWWMAAVLAGGEAAVLSHRDAAALHALLRADYGPINITVPRQLRDRDGLRFHHRFLSSDEITTVDRIPTTTVVRTIFDLAASEPRRAVERAIHEADVQRTFDLRALQALVDRSPRARGIGHLKAILADRRFGATITKEELEEGFIAFLEEEDVPLPEFNVWLRIGDRWIEADAVWRKEKVIVELDGWSVHGTRRNFETDRERDRALQVAGWRPIRVTWRHLHHGRSELAGDLHELLGTRRRRRAS